MCTAVSYKTQDFYFGRTLDYQHSYIEEVTITPRNFPFEFRDTGVLKTHFAIIGMAYVCEGYPLYYDAINEKGLCMAGLNFVGNAHYSPPLDNSCNVAQFELIPYILSRCDSVKSAREQLEKINITNETFNSKLPAAQLHWIVADKAEAITIECTREGVLIYDNPIGVLTNNPPFPMQMFNLSNYIHVSNKEPQNLFSDKISLKAYSRGMGALGLPGDLSSQSRFVRAAFAKLNSVSGRCETESISQFFHILGFVSQTKGLCEVKKGEYEITIYTSCCNADKGIYYYTTYNNHQITAVDMQRHDLDSADLKRFPLILEEQIKLQC